MGPGSQFAGAGEMGEMHVPPSVLMRRMARSPFAESIMKGPERALAILGEIEDSGICGQGKGERIFKNARRLFAERSQSGELDKVLEEIEDLGYALCRLFAVGETKKGCTVTDVSAHWARVAELRLIAAEVQESTSKVTRHYAKAALFFENAGVWSGAAEAHVKAAECHMGKDAVLGLRHYLEAAENFKLGGDSMKALEIESLIKRVVEEKGINPRDLVSPDRALIALYMWRRSIPRLP